MEKLANNGPERYDSESYFDHYYAEPHADDDLVLSLACEALKEALPSGSLRIVDVGTGPNMYPLLAALPRASSITAWEYSGDNVTWLNSELSRSELRPQWLHFWRVAQLAYGSSFNLDADPLLSLKDRVVVHQGSIYDLPPRHWDAATMFFCAEAVTDKDTEFVSACESFTRCVRVGGTVIAGFLLNSASYVHAGQRYPVMTVTEPSLREIFSNLTTGLAVKLIGVTDTEVRSGYTGMALVTAKSA